MSAPIRVVLRKRNGDLLAEGRFRAEYRALDGDAIHVTGLAEDGRKLQLVIPCALLEFVPSAEEQAAEDVARDVARRAEDVVLSRLQL